jgi:hypothetical protein
LEQTAALFESPKSCNHKWHTFSSEWLKTID